MQFLSLFKVSNSGARYTNIPKHWVNEHVVVDSIARFREAGWRKKVSLLMVDP